MSNNKKVIQPKKSKGRKYHIKRDGGLLCSKQLGNHLLVTNMYFAKTMDKENLCSHCYGKYLSIKNQKS